MVDITQQPYFDDYDESKNFHQILFRPGYAVQTRELNQLQSIIKNQIDRFGKHVFREGSLVTGGAYDLEIGVPVIKVSTLLPLNVDPQLFVDKNITSSISGMKANIRAVEYDAEEEVYVFFVRYTSAGDDSDVFIENDVLAVDDVMGMSATVEEDGSEFGSLFTIDAGVTFIKGYFVKFDKQTIVLEKYLTDPTYTIGFNVTVEDISSVEDSSLLDNAQGSFNYAAPGANRLAIDCVIGKVALGDDALDQNFINLLDIKDGQIVESNERSQYSKIYEEISKRTYDESGDYYVSGFGIRTREHLNTGSNEGYLTDLEGGDPDLLSIDIEPGLAYVKGYEVNKLVTQHIPTKKSQTFDQLNNQPITAKTGGYLLVNEVLGTPALDVGTIVNIYETAQSRITNNIALSTGPSGEIIGTAKIKSVILDSGNLGTPWARLRVYLYDIETDSPTQPLSTARALSIAGVFYANIVVPASGLVDIIGATDNVLIYPLGTDYTKSIRDVSGNVDTSFTFQKTSVVAVDTVGSFTVTISGTNETLPWGPGLVSDKKDILVTANSSTVITLPGTVSTTAGSFVVTGVGTSFLKYNAGDRIRIGPTDIYVIAGIISNTSMGVHKNVPGTASGLALSRIISVGDHINFNGNGSTSLGGPDPNPRTVTVNGTSLSMTLEMKDALPGGFEVTVSYPISRNVAQEIGKTLRSDRYVKIDCSSLAAGSSLSRRILSLGIPDVYRIKEVRGFNEAFEAVDAEDAAAQGFDVTKFFTLLTNQKDNQYDHSAIQTTRLNLNSANKLLIKLDYFEPDFSAGRGYFSIDSYPVDDSVESDTTIFTHQIPSYISSTGIKYNLKDCLDFRPMKSSTASDTTTPLGATVNPVPSAFFYEYTAGLRIPMPGSQVRADYSFYLSRRDVVTLDKNGVISVIEGDPAVFPLLPKISENVMALANVYIPPYPSISESYGRILKVNETAISQRVANKRHTQREIGVLKQRIDNLEYYNALNLLETNANDWILTGEIGPRLKNGFFVDGFLDHSLGATTLPDYSIAVDKIEQSIRPVFDMESFKYDFNIITSSGVESPLKTGNLITLPYTEVALIRQMSATAPRNVAQSSYRFIGELLMTPDNDTWVDIKTVDKTLEFGNDLPTNRIMTSEWNSWEDRVTGYNAIQRRDGSGSSDTSKPSVSGSFSSFAGAIAGSTSTKSLGVTISSPTTDLRATQIETIDSNQRAGIRTNVNVDRDVAESGNFVTDVSLIPYIRPQTIFINTQGLKPNTRHYIFFDGENMRAWSSLLSSWNLGSPIRSDASGKIVMGLVLPDNGIRFRVGTKEVVLTDSSTNSVQASSYAKASFVASGLNVQKQNTILSTRAPQISQQDEIVNAGSSRLNTSRIVDGSSMAYTFNISVPKKAWSLVNQEADGDRPEGVFLTSVDIYVRTRDANYGAKIEIREVNSSGNITQSVVPYSTVWLAKNAGAWNTSATAAVATRITFPSPVFLYDNTQYALVISPEMVNPGLYLWVSVLGETDVLTNERITSRAQSGNLLTSNNGRNWSIVPDTDLKVRFNRARFTTNTEGTVIFSSRAYEFFEVEGTDIFSLFGDTIYGSSEITLSGVTGGGAAIAVNDIINGTTSGTSATIIRITSGTYYTNGRGFVEGEPFTITGKSRVGTIATENHGVAYLRAFETIPDSITDIDSGPAGIPKHLMRLDRSNGAFFEDAVLTSQYSNKTATITEIKDFKYSTTNLKPAFLNFNKTSIRFEKRGLDAATLGFGSINDGWVLGNQDATSSFGTERVMLSASVEKDTPSLLFSGSQIHYSSEFRAKMTTLNEYISPVIDTSRSHSAYVHNLINTTVTGEDGKSGGSLINKYISKKVTLADGQDAEDIVVRLSAYRPSGSDIKVWIKILSSDDSSTLDQREWIELENEADTVSSYSSSANINDFIELKYTFKQADRWTGEGSGLSQLDIETNDLWQVVKYVTEGGITVYRYKQFAIKIGLLGSNSALVPRVADLRVVALQV